MGTTKTTRAAVITRESHSGTDRIDGPGCSPENPAPDLLWSFAVVGGVCLTI